MIRKPIKPLKKPKVKQTLYAFDFDGTLAEPAPAGRTGDPIVANVERVRKLGRLTGKKLAIYTSRPWSDFGLIVEFVMENRLPVSEVVCNKFLADVYLDDRAVNVREESWIPDWLQ